MCSLTGAPPSWAAGLQGCRDVRIGSQLHKGISGGQAKRTNIGIALVTRPNILFLDEPTSGLDSTAGSEVMLTVKRLVNNGTTIIATIHSPTATAFALFDRLMMLSHGRVAFFGHPGVQLMDYCEQSLVPLVGGSMDAFERHQAEALVDLVTRAGGGGVGVGVGGGVGGGGCGGGGGAAVGPWTCGVQGRGRCTPLRALQLPWTVTGVASSALPRPAGHLRRVGPPACHSGQWL